jgi:hypothetical protein
MKKLLNTFSQVMDLRFGIVYSPKIKHGLLLSLQGKFHEKFPHGPASLKQALSAEIRGEYLIKRLESLFCKLIRFYMLFDPIYLIIDGLVHS